MPKSKPPRRAAPRTPRAERSAFAEVPRKTVSVPDPTPFQPPDGKQVWGARPRILSRGKLIAGATLATGAVGGASYLAHRRQPVMKLYDPFTDSDVVFEKANGQLIERSRSALSAMKSEYKRGRTLNQISNEMRERGVGQKLEAKDTRGRVARYVGRNRNQLLSAAGGGAVGGDVLRRATTSKVEKGYAKDFGTAARGLWKHPIKAQKTGAGARAMAMQAGGMLAGEGLGRAAVAGAKRSKNLSPATRRKIEMAQEAKLPRMAGGMVGGYSSIPGTARRMRAAGLSKRDGQVPKPRLSGDGGFIHLVSTGTLRPTGAHAGKGLDVKVVRRNRRTSEPSQKLFHTGSRTR